MFTSENPNNEAQLIDYHFRSKSNWRRNTAKLAIITNVNVQHSNKTEKTKWYSFHFDSHESNSDCLRNVLESPNIADIYASRLDDADDEHKYRHKNWCKLSYLFFFSFVCDVWICRQMDDSYLPLWLAISALRNQSEVIASIVRERHCQFKFEQLQQQQTIKIYKFIFQIAHTQHRQKWTINLNYCNDLVFRSEK